MREYLKRIFVVVLAAVIMTATIPEGYTVKAADYISAPTVKLDGKWSNKSWQEYGEGNWYKFVVPSDGEVCLKIMSYYGAEYMRIYTEDLSEYLAGTNCYGSEKSPGATSKTVILSKGTYYLKSSTYGLDSGNYRFSLSFKSYKTNDSKAISYDSPQKYLLGSTIVGAITSTDKEDWFKVYIPTSGRYLFKVTANCGAKMNVKNSDLTETIDINSYSYNTYSQAIDLKKGTHYIYINDYLGYYGKYSFSLKNYIGKTDMYVYNVAKKSFVVYWEKQYGSTNYIIRYSTDRKMKKNVKTIKVSGRTKSKKIKNLKKNKKYYCQVRATIKVGKKTLYGAWSQKVGVRTLE